MATPLTPAEVAARNSSPTLRDVLQNVAPAFNIPTHAAVLNDLAMRAEALVPSYEYGHTLTNGAGDFDQMLDTMATYMVDPNTDTLGPFDYAIPEKAAFGWMAGGYKANGPFGEGHYASTRVFIIWAPWWSTRSPYMVMTTPMQMVAEGKIHDEIPEHVRPRKIVNCWTFSDAIRTLRQRSMGLWNGCT